MGATQLECDISKLSLADRWRLLRWLARQQPALVQRGILTIGATRKQDARILDWKISGSPEGMAGGS